MRSIPTTGSVRFDNHPRGRFMPEQAAMGIAASPG
jgi:hypothetical protein